MSRRPTPEQVDIAREARALRRDNATDAVERVIRAQVPGLTHEQAWPLAEAVVTELAAWIRQHGGPFHTAAGWAAELLEEAAPWRPSQDRTLDEQATATTRCPTCLAPPGVECDKTDGLRWYAHAARVLAMSRESSDG